MILAYVDQKEVGDKHLENYAWLIRILILEVSLKSKKVTIF